MGELVLCANARLPSQRAQSLQVVAAACSFARAGETTTLVHARRANTPSLPAGTDLFSYYAVPSGPRATVVDVPCKDWIDRVPTALQYLPARIQELTFSREAARWIRAHAPAATVISREIEAARELLKAGQARVFLEIHRVPGGRARRAWLRQVALGARGVLAISGGVRDDLLALGLTPDSVLVAHDAYEAARFARPPAREEARRALGIPNGELVVSYTGGLLEWKGVDDLVEAARLLPGITFLVAGGTPADVERVRRRAAGLGHVRIDGFQPPERVALYLAAADLMAVPNRSRPAISSRYTSPLKVFEGMALGVPMVASNLPSLRELLAHAENAWLVEPDNPRALAAGIERVLGDPGLCHDMAQRLRDRAGEHTWDARAARVLAWMAGRG